jgi:hypothetical protein
LASCWKIRRWQENSIAKAEGGMTRAPHRASAPPVHPAPEASKEAFLPKLSGSESNRCRPFGDVTIDHVAAIAAIQNEVASAYGLTVMDLLSPRRGVALKARQEAMWWARRQTGASYPALGRAFDRDHSTVLYNVRLVERQIADAMARR